MVSVDVGRVGCGGRCGVRAGEGGEGGRGESMARWCEIAGEVVGDRGEVIGDRGKMAGGRGKDAQMVACGGWLGGWRGA